MHLTVHEHPLLDLRAFVARFPRELRDLEPAAGLVHFLSLEATAPIASSDDVRSAVRRLLRYGGFKPTGRSKPASEYLIKAATEGTLASINLAVDACNVVSLHSGLPISVVDLAVARGPFHVAVAPAGASYVFNPSGQSMDLGGLLCLYDAEGPCANAVKDSQRTKTSLETQSTLSLIWGSRDLPGRAAAAEVWYHEWLQAHGCEIESCWP